MLPVVSLFSGAGGLDLGIRRAGDGVFDFRAWVEKDPDCRATLRANHPELLDSPKLLDDIEDVSPEILMRVARLREGEAFLLAGGPPCQAFSTAGPRNSIKGISGRLVHSYFAMVQTLQPRFFLFENVRGLLSAAITHRPLVDRAHPKEIPDDAESRLGSVMDQLILPKFSKLGYEVVYGILCAADFGSAQVRHRLIMLGSRDREFRAGVFRKQTSSRMEPRDLVPQTHHRYAPYPPLQRWRTLRDAIGDLAKSETDPGDTYSYSDERAAVFRELPSGKNWKWFRDNPKRFPDKYLRQVMGGAMFSGGGKEGFWRRLSWDRPAPTLTAQPQQLASSLCHPELERPLSILEYAAIQDFPPEYVFYGSKSSRYRQIGNAVPIRLAEAVGRAILAVAAVKGGLGERTTGPGNTAVKRERRHTSPNGRPNGEKPFLVGNTLPLPFIGPKRRGVSVHEISLPRD
jgi:DNA (cytosine-5)-methyltransferase 1